MVKITVLNDNRCEDKQLECEHGISLLIECDGKRVLFDAGTTDIFIRNAEKLNVDLSDIDAIVLSHGDYDHGNGLKYLNVKTDLICHPDFDIVRISKRTGNNNGLNQTREELKQKFSLIESRAPYYITDNIIFLGEIDRKNFFEIGKNLPAWDEKGNTYPHLDDSGLVIKSKRGLIVFSGCAHSGICNTIDYAKRVTGENKVCMVIGGFHLKNIDEQTIETIKYVRDNDIGQVMLAHCTSDIVCDEFVRELPNVASVIKTGDVYTI